jgi:hypothetical protein
MPDGTTTMEVISKAKKSGRADPLPPENEFEPATSSD